MKTRPFGQLGFDVSAFGMGCMRLPILDGDNRKINEPEAIAMIRHAIDSGVTYIDTAYVYHGGQSEVVLGKALKDGYREKVKIATKLPLWEGNVNEETFERILNESLERLGVDSIDFYLLHSMNAERFRTAKEAGVLEWLDRKVAEGKIKYPSFSFHDDNAAFHEILDAYDWKMCQVQMNILDTENQAQLEGIRYAGSKGIPVVIMEPLCGGALAGAAPANVQAIYDAFPVRRSPIEWAFRFLYDMPEIAVILSGVSTMEQLDDNLRIFDQAEIGAMSDAEHKLMEEIITAYKSRVRIGCTGCRYCMPCPFGVGIPDIFGASDRASMFDRPEMFEKDYARIAKDGHGADKCVACGACAKVCPQKISIPQLMAEFAEKMK